MRTIPLSFPNRDGEILDGVIEVGTVPIQAWAVFAHCFSCDKTSLAAVRISRALAARGIGVLRFDFTGLGKSEGQFGHGLSHDAQDIADAVGAMATAGRPVRLLVGHSFGGAAALAVAGSLESVKAVAVIGTPFEPEHIFGHLDRPVTYAAAIGAVPVNIGGRPFSLKAEFASDIRSQNQGPRIATLGKALLVLHSPLDSIVSIDHATRIFTAARHPKSFISLDQADHLLRRAEDAEYVAASIAGWSSRFLDIAEPALFAIGDGVRVSETGVGNFQVLVETPTAQFLADEPGDAGGLDTGPTPYELVSAGLGACTVMTCRLYAARKGWPLARTTVEITHAGRTPGARESFTRRISFDGDLDEGQRARLLEIANKCPVHRTLTEEADVQTELMPPGAAQPPMLGEAENAGAFSAIAAAAPILNAETSP